MDNVVRLPLTVTRRVGLTKSRRSRHMNYSEANIVRKAAGVRTTLTRTKSLLGAALRVWELKQRISD